ncbi:MAG: serine hydrolase [Firmicutes bacterium]|nr:serine hydrolase [Bacillota bacterium]
MRTKIQALYEAWNQEDNFSGVFSVQDAGGAIFEEASGSRNMGECLPNNPETRFGIASGTKIFTAVAVCMLIDQGKLRLEDKLLDILDADFLIFRRP